MNIVLIGFMGSGKTTIAKLLGQKLNWQVFDIDSYIEEKEGKKIKDIFEESGESFFRELETDACRIISQKDGIIISTGGGIVTKEENILLLRRNSIIIYLNASSDILKYRLKKERENRPLLSKKNWEVQFDILYEKRQQLYLDAADKNLQTDYLNPDAILVQIEKLLKEKEGK